MTAKKLEQFSSSLKSIDCVWGTSMDQYAQFFKKEFTWGGEKVLELDMSLLEKKHLQVLGTIGGGNHFAEFQEVEEMADPDTFTALGLDQNEVFMLVHSGSRTLG